MPKNYKGYQIIKRGNSFQIRINHQGKTYFYTFHPSEGLTPSKQYAEAEKEAIRLRDRIRSGYSGTMPTFREYANYVLETKKSLILKRSTQNGYKYILRRILDEFGDDTLDRITPARLNQFYIKTQKDTTKIPSSAEAKGNKLREYLKTQSITITKLSETASISAPTASYAVNGKRVSIHTAKAICNALQLNLEDYFTVISNQTTLSDQTVLVHIRLINAIMNQAVRENLIETNPVSATIKPKNKPSKPNYFQPDEVSAIWKCIGEEPLKWQVIISLLIITGCRRSEIAGLKWNNILWDDNILRINSQALYNEDDGIYNEESTKNEDVKYVQIDDYSAKLLRKYYNSFCSDMKALGLKKQEYPNFCFFQTGDISKPMHPSTINEHLRAFSKKHGFRKINPHSLRHSLASALIAAGVDENAVSKQLGHKQVATTRNIYVHEIKEYQAKVAQKLPTLYQHGEDPDTEDTKKAMDKE